MTSALRFLGLSVLFACACASIAATQTFELSTQSVAMPGLPSLPSGQAQTVALSTEFGSCSKSALGNLDKVRASNHVDSVDVWVIVHDVELRSNATFEGIQQLNLQLVTQDETVSICNRSLSTAEQKASTIECALEYRVRAEQLCPSPSTATATAPARMTIQLQVLTGNITLTSVDASITVETEVDAEVSL